VNIHDPLFEQSLWCLRFHCNRAKGDQTLLDVFNRLLAKSVRPSGWTDNTHLNIQPHQITSRRENLPATDLAALTGHKFTNGEDFDCPIVVAEYQGAMRILDGNHRINRWAEACDTALHAVNFHTVGGVGQFVEHPAVENDA
jgi:hypothetical protein